MPSSPCRIAVLLVWTETLSKVAGARGGYEGERRRAGQEVHGTYTTMMQVGAPC